MRGSAAQADAGERPAGEPGSNRVSGDDGDEIDRVHQLATKTQGVAEEIDEMSTAEP